MPEAVHTNGHAGAEVAPKAKTLPVREKESAPQEELITKAFAEFVLDTTSDALTPEITTKLKALFLDYLGVSIAAGQAGESTPYFVKGITAFAGSAKGTSTVITKGSNFLPQYAAILNGAFCHTYDFDDTHCAAILHPGASIISAVLAEAELENQTGADVLLAILVGYEIACRIGTALGSGAYSRGFHNTNTAGIYGSVAAICKLRKVSLNTIENAFGLAVSRAGGAMQFLDNGAWNKRLHPGFAAHDALLCVTLAQAEILGASKPIEGKYGLLHNFSESGKPDNLTKQLGSTWSFLETACKPFPACRMTHGQLEMAGKIAAKNPSKGTPTSITVTLPPANHPIVGFPNPNKINPKSVVDAQFSAYYQTAASYLYGSNQGWSIYEKISDAAVQDLCRKITTEIDNSYSNLESRMKVTFDDGSVAEEEVKIPIAEVERPFEWDTGVQKKFKGLAVPVFGEEKSQRICGLVDGIAEVNVRELMKLLATV